MSPFLQLFVIKQQQQQHINSKGVFSFKWYLISYHGKAITNIYCMSLSYKWKYMNDTSINYLWAQATNSHKTLTNRPHTSSLMQDQFS